MSFELIKKVNQAQQKDAVLDVRSGDTVRVHQKIKEGNKERIQVFEGVVIRTDRKKSHTSRITVRKIASGVGVEKSFILHSPLVEKIEIASGVGVEKSFLLHSPLLEKIEIVRRAKVRRNYLSFLRNRSGKSARLKQVAFDREAINTLPETSKAEKVEATNEKVEEVKEA